MWLRASYLTGMAELLEAYGGTGLVRNVFGHSAISPAAVADPYQLIDYENAAIVFDSILLNVDSLEDFCRLNGQLGLVNPWGLGEVFAGQARSGTLLEYWARLQSITPLMIERWRSSLRDDNGIVSMVSDWSRYPGVGFPTIGACFSAHRIKDLFGITPLTMRMPYEAGHYVNERLKMEFPEVEFQFAPPIQMISYRRSEVLGAAPIPEVAGPPISHQDILKAYYPENRRAMALRILACIGSMIAAAEDPTLESVAENVGVSPRELQRVFASGGLSMRSSIERIRVLIAERLLVETDDPIIDIALASGYTSHQALTKVFKRWRGLAPTEYRFYLDRNRRQNRAELASAQ